MSLGQTTDVTGSIINENTSEGVQDTVEYQMKARPEITFQAISDANGDYVLYGIPRDSTNSIIDPTTGMEIDRTYMERQGDELVFKVATQDRFRPGVIVNVAGQVIGEAVGQDKGDYYEYRWRPTSDVSQLLFFSNGNKQHTQKIVHVNGQYMGDFSRIEQTSMLKSGQAKSESTQTEYYMSITNPDFKPYLDSVKFDHDVMNWVTHYLIPWDTFSANMDITAQNNATGLPISNAQVQVEEVGNEENYFSDYTNTQGVVAFEDIPIPNYEPNKEYADTIRLAVEILSQGRYEVKKDTFAITNENYAFTIPLDSIITPPNNFRFDGNVSPSDGRFTLILSGDQFGVDTVYNNMMIAQYDTTVQSHDEQLQAQVIFEKDTLFEKINELYTAQSGRTSRDFTINQIRWPFTFQGNLSPEDGYFTLDIVGDNTPAQTIIDSLQAENYLEELIAEDPTLQVRAQFTKNDLYSEVDQTTNENTGTITKDYSIEQIRWPFTFQGNLSPEDGYFTLDIEGENTPAQTIIDSLQAENYLEELIAEDPTLQVRAQFTKNDLYSEVDQTTNENTGTITKDYSIEQILWPLALQLNTEDGEGEHLPNVDYVVKYLVAPNDVIAQGNMGSDAQETVSLIHPNDTLQAIVELTLNKYQSIIDTLNVTGNPTIKNYVLQRVRHGYTLSGDLTDGSQFTLIAQGSEHPIDTLINNQVLDDYSVDFTSLDSELTFQALVSRDTLYNTIDSTFSVASGTHVRDFPLTQVRWPFTFQGNLSPEDGYFTLQVQGDNTPAQTLMDSVSAGSYLAEMIAEDPTLQVTAQFVKDTLYSKINQTTSEDTPGVTQDYTLTQIRWPHTVNVDTKDENNNPLSDVDIFILDRYAVSDTLAKLNSGAGASVSADMILDAANKEIIAHYKKSSYQTSIDTTTLSTVITNLEALLSPELVADGYFRAVIRQDGGSYPPGKIVYRGLNVVYSDSVTITSPPYADMTGVPIPTEDGYALVERDIQPTTTPFVPTIDTVQILSGDNGVMYHDVFSVPPIPQVEQIGGNVTLLLTGGQQGDGVDVVWKREDGTVIDSARTDANGDYLFSQVPTQTDGFLYVRFPETDGTRRDTAYYKHSGAPLSTLEHIVEEDDTIRTNHNITLIPKWIDDPYTGAPVRTEIDDIEELEGLDINSERALYGIENVYLDFDSHADTVWFNKMKAFGEEVMGAFPINIVETPRNITLQMQNDYKLRDPSKQHLYGWNFSIDGSGDVTYYRFAYDEGFNLIIGDKINFSGDSLGYFKEMFYRTLRVRPVNPANRISVMNPDNPHSIDIPTAKDRVYHTLFRKQRERQINGTAFYRLTYLEE